MPWRRLLNEYQIYALRDRYDHVKKVMQQTCHTGNFSIRISTVLAQHKLRNNKITNAENIEHTPAPLPRVVKIICIYQASFEPPANDFLHPIGLIMWRDSRLSCLWPSAFFIRSLIFFYFFCFVPIFFDLYFFCFCCLICSLLAAFVLVCEYKCTHTCREYTARMQTKRWSCQSSISSTRFLFWK